MDPSGWWMSEKFDGMRLFWDGSQFFSRSGNKINVPDFITSALPNVPLDGELW
jgi:DNA ligase-1